MLFAKSREVLWYFELIFREFLVNICGNSAYGHHLAVTIFYMWRHLQAATGHLKFLIYTTAAYNKEHISNN